MSTMVHLLSKDIRTIYRDSFLLAMVAIVPCVALGLRFGLPFVPIEHIELYAAPFIVSYGGMLVATVFGFAMIEEREQRTDLLLRVVPLTQEGYFGYLVTTTVLFSFAAGLGAALVYGQNMVDVPGFLLMTAIGSLQTPLVMLLLGVAARNKIEGMALSKIVGSVSMVFVALFVLPAQWQILVAWIPHYWIYLGLLQAYAGEAQLAMLPIYWPPVPSWLPPLAAGATSTIGIALLARLHARRTD